MWYTSLALAILKRSGDLTIDYAMTNSPYMPNFGSLLHPHGLEEAPVVHQPSPSHIGDVCHPHHWLFHGQYVVIGTNVLAISVSTNSDDNQNKSKIMKQTITIPVLQLCCCR